MGTPKFKEGDEVLVFCRCGCTNHGRGKVLECRPFDGGTLGFIMKMRNRRIPKFIYRVSCSKGGWVPDIWVHPIPPTEPQVDKLKEQMGQWAKEAEAEPA